MPGFLSSRPRPLQIPSSTGRLQGESEAKKNETQRRDCAWWLTLASHDTPDSNGLGICDRSFMASIYISIETWMVWKKRLALRIWSEDIWSFFDSYGKSHSLYHLYIYIHTVVILYGPLSMNWFSCRMLRMFFRSCQVPLNAEGFINIWQVFHGGISMGKNGSCLNMRDNGWKRDFNIQWIIMRNTDQIAEDNLIRFCLCYFLFGVSSSGMAAASWDGTSFMGNIMEYIPGWVVSINQLLEGISLYLWVADLCETLKWPKEDERPPISFLCVPLNCLYVPRWFSLGGVDDSRFFGKSQACSHFGRYRWKTKLDVLRFVGFLSPVESPFFSWLPEVARTHHSSDWHDTTSSKPAPRPETRHGKATWQTRMDFETFR